MENNLDIESTGECTKQRSMKKDIWSDSIKCILFVIFFLDLSGCHGSDVFRGNGNGKNIAANIANTAKKNERDYVFSNPMDLALDKSGNIFVVDSGDNTVKKISAAGTVSVFAGKPGVQGWRDGVGAEAEFDTPVGIAIDSNGNLFVVESQNCTIRKITSEGRVTLLAGFPKECSAVDGNITQARFPNPRGIAVDKVGNVYVLAMHAIRRISPDGTVITYAGSSNQIGYQDGVGNEARFAWPRGIAVDMQGNAIVADTSNDVIRKISPNRLVTTIAGIQGVPGFNDGFTFKSKLRGPLRVAFGENGDLYISDRGNRAIRMLDSHGALTTLVDATQIRDGEVELMGPDGVTISQSGDVYIVDTEPPRVS